MEWMHVKGMEKAKAFNNFSHSLLLRKCPARKPAEEYMVIPQSIPAITESRVQETAFFYSVCVIFASVKSGQF